MIVRKETLDELAQAVIAYAKEQVSQSSASIVLLEGNLGAGKTTFVQHVARLLGVEESVTSPTFVLMRSYPTKDPLFTRLVHIDAYRIESEEEVTPLHLQTVFDDPHALVCVEWPKNLGNALPTPILTLTMAVKGEDERDVTINPSIEPYFATSR